MVAKYGGPLGSFLAAYFALLLFCFSVFVFEGGVWLIAGLTSWVCCILFFFGWFLRYNAKYSNNLSLDKESFIDEMMFFASKPFILQGEIIGLLLRRGMGIGLF